MHLLMKVTGKKKNTKIEEYDLYEQKPVDKIGEKKMGKDVRNKNAMIDAVINIDTRKKGS